ncbi:unnamed protein product [Macrosiphum euphorbiae]|uniref:HAT C-terminal dimerisation domain-containing protein n=1 Tax=Macrosiphum euphorbiae TaxID=13131 RepID=A0AAV0WIL5_9HEMI|nr:unnamed protein product [Macrosiphum euphorbiae]
MPKIMNCDDPVRRYFKYHSEGENANKSTCKIQNCNKILAGNHLGNLKRHLKVFHTLEYQQILLEEDEISTDTTNTVTMSSISSNSPDLFPPTQKRVHSAEKTTNVSIKRRAVIDGCIEMVTINGRPLKIMEDSGFRKIVDPIFRSFGFTMNGDVVRNHICIRASLVRQAITEQMKKKFFCIKMDTATRLGRTILGINVQFIHEGKIIIRNLATTEVYQTTSTNLKCVLLKTLEKYSLDPSFIYSITTDNGANMLKTVSLLREMNRDYDINEEMSENEYNVEDNQVQIDEENSNNFSECSDEDNHIINEHENNQDTFPSIINDLGAAVNTSEVFSRHQTRLHVDNDFWTSTNDLKIALGPAKITSCVLQAEQLYPGDCLLHWKKCIIHTRKINSFISNSIVEAMQRRETTLFNCDSFKLAIFLDGRVNVLLDENTLREAKNHLILLSSELHNIDPVIREGPTISNNNIECNEVDDLELELRTAAAERISGLISSQDQVVLDIQREIVNFMQLPREDKSKNIMDIWTRLKKMYPLMYECALVALALPTTQVTVERLFSSLKFILNDQRNRMNASLLEDIMVVRSNYLFDKS